MTGPMDICEMHAGCMATGYRSNGEKITGSIFIDDYLFNGVDEFPIFKLKSVNGDEFCIFDFDSFIVSRVDER